MTIVVVLLLLAVGFSNVKPLRMDCDIIVKESATFVYNSQIYRLNSTKLVNVMQMKILQYNDIFAIDSHSKVLQATRRIDRESLCKQYETCDCAHQICVVPVPILVIYLPTTNDPPYRITVNVCVADINDNVPSFPDHTQTLNLNENVDVGATYELLSATDEDSENFTVVRYELQCTKMNFNLSYNILRHGSHRSNHHVKVTVTVKTVYEQQPILCNLSACDVDNCGVMRLLIKINDVNDHRPFWKETVYFRSINETILPDSVIDRFVAIDEDPMFGTITYSISRTIVSSDQKALSEGYFSIDSLTGELRINKVVDYEDSSLRRFDIIIVAKDNGTPALSSSTTLLISVANVNDNPPKIILNKVIIDVKENSKPSFLDYFTVTDDDEIDTDKMSCDVSEPENYFKLKKSSLQAPIIFEVYSTGSFDYEKQSSVTVVIRCEDGGQPSMSSVKRLTVNILDVNDNSVYFPQKVIHAFVAENSPIGTEVTRLTAVDLDKKSSLVYMLSSPGSSTFVNVDSYHGYLTVNEVFDRETKDLYVFKVRVEERDFGNFSDVADVYLRITDTNDNIPQFKEQYTFSVAENTSISAFIGRIEAVDVDLGNNGSVTYHQGTQVGKMMEFFRVSSTGEIRLFQQLDFERQSIHNLVIVARDHGNLVTLSSTTSVIIKVIDSNDHPPRFEEKTSSLTLPCQSQDIGKDLITITDKDQSEENTRINYEIEKVDPSRYKSVFHINKSSGFISMNVTKDQCRFRGSSKEKVELTLKIFDPTKIEFKDRANLILYLESERFEERVDSGKTTIQKGQSNWRKKNRQSYNQRELDNSGRIEEFVDQNVIIVMILIFITIFLGIILVSLVCFIKRRRDTEEEQEIVESLGMIMEKVNSPLQSTDQRYIKNGETLSLTMKNISANSDNYYPTLTNNSRIMINDVNIRSNSPKTGDKKIDNNLLNYQISKAKDQHAYQSLTLSPRIDEPYSVIETFLGNSLFRTMDKNQNDSLNSPQTPPNRSYVSVSFV